ncbi:dysbindin domain-containing protein 1 isoform X1 [Talpa occidentalis]|uniref:dysbindin domain-containing protein 1 isoform X1 n=1 Tax=Talpa occidentalis TaxID=50954 RepID=UPI0023F943B2|nr:dysbindin domain-containing protein 1 isoform X1 [Talpa occidentalis]
MEAPEGAKPRDVVTETGGPPAAPGARDRCPVPEAEEEDAAVPTPAPGLLQVAERRQPLSSVSSLEVHFDLLDLAELADMSDQELAEVFADSDDETGDTPAGRPRAGTDPRAIHLQASGPMSSRFHTAPVLATTPPPDLPWSPHWWVWPPAAEHRGWR